MLARLPVRSLTAPLAWTTLLVDGNTSAADVQVAAAAAARCPAGVAWRRGRDAGQALAPCLWFQDPRKMGEDDEEEMFEHGATEADTPAALLRALGPLLAAVTPGAGGQFFATDPRFSRTSQDGAARALWMPYFVQLWSGSSAGVPGGFEVSTDGAGDPSTARMLLPVTLEVQASVERQMTAQKFPKDSEQCTQPLGR